MNYRHVGHARQDPEFFVAQHPPPVLLDEIQYAPELLPVIKRRIDREDTPGQYFLSGSPNLALLLRHGPGRFSPAYLFA